MELTKAFQDLAWADLAISLGKISPKVKVSLHATMLFLDNTAGF
jgi:hypothetical protein